MTRPVSVKPVPFMDLARLHAPLEAELVRAWRTVMAESAFIGGAHVERFEAEWAAYCGTAHAVGVSDGTAAIELALAGLGIGAGDEVIVPANTFIATVEAVVRTGARPVLIDVDPATLLMTAKGVAEAISPATAAVIAVHLYGQPVNMDAIGALARARGLALIEDAAQAHGASWRGRKAGALGDVGCFSFYPGKNLGAFGDAGAVTTNDAALAERIRCRANHGRIAEAPGQHAVLDGNHRLDGLQAAILSVKLGHLDRWNEERRRIARAYAEGLAGLPLRLPEIHPDASSCHHLAVLELGEREAVRRGLAEKGVASGVHYPIPCHLQPACAAFPTPPLPAVERAADRLLSLPLFPGMDEAEIGHVLGAMRALLEPSLRHLETAPASAC